MTGENASRFKASPMGKPVEGEVRCEMSTSRLRVICHPLWTTRPTFSVVQLRMTHTRPSGYREPNMSTALIKKATPEEILGDSEWMTVGEAASYFHVCTETIRRAHRTGNLKVTHVGRHIRVPKRELILWRERGCQTKPVNGQGER